MYFSFYQMSSCEGILSDKNIGGYSTVIQAYDKEEAIKKAKQFGLYFNGVSSGRDCEFCGCRFGNPIEHKNIYDLLNDEAHSIILLKEQYHDSSLSIIIHHLNGRKEYARKKMPFDSSRN
jgi:hypothetical protein